MDRFRVHLSKETFKFSSTHFTLFSASEAERLHGHNYQVSVECEFEKLDAFGMGFEFNALKPHIKSLTERWDERVLIPGKSPHLKVSSEVVRGEPHLTVDFANRSYRFPSADVVLLETIDLVSQVTGGLAVWDARIDEMRRFQWPFPDLSLSLFATGKKMATHKHLAVSAPMEESTLEEMRSWVEDAVQSLALHDADRLIASVRGFGRVLADQGRVADHTVSLLEELADLSGVRAAKGCGAMGSDVVLVLHDPSAVDDLNSFRIDNGLRLAATQADIRVGGVEFKTAGAST